MRVICDIETDSLDPSFVWCIVCRDIDSGAIYPFWRPDLDRKEFLSFAKQVSLWSGHYFIKFDYSKVIRKFFPEITLSPKDIRDTVVMSRLFNYPLKGGHGLEAWGERLGIKKPTIDNFETVDKDEILNRCTVDTEINLALFKRWEKFLNDPRYKDAIDLEHEVEFICVELETNGFPFDIDEAKFLKEKITGLLQKLDKEILLDFKPKACFVREVVPRATKNGLLNLNDFRWLPPGSDLSMFSTGEPFSLVEFREFNPASVPQQIERLNQAGWRPFEKTDGHIECLRLIQRLRGKVPEALLERKKHFQEVGWKVSEANLETLPPNAPDGARKLAQRIILASRASVLNEWINAYREATECVHGRFNGIGSWTHRMSHQEPNQANIPSDPDVRDKRNPSPIEQIKLEYGVSLRKLWTSGGPDFALIGTDADAIQLRILAHYMNDEAFTKALVEGDKDLGTDAHTLNAVRLGIGPERRPVAKTFDTIEVYKTVKFSGTLSEAILSQANY